MGLEPGRLLLEGHRQQRVFVGRGLSVPRSLPEETSGLRCGLCTHTEAMTARLALGLGAWGCVCPEPSGETARSGEFLPRRGYLLAITARLRISVRASVRISLWVWLHRVFDWTSVGRSVGGCLWDSQGEGASFLTARSFWGCESVCIPSSRPRGASGCFTGRTLQRAELCSWCAPRSGRPWVCVCI